jgi:hypothetical protein
MFDGGLFQTKPQQKATLKHGMKSGVDFVELLNHRLSNLVQSRVVPFAYHYRPVADGTD